jgi:ribosome modulation factor
MLRDELRVGRYPLPRSSGSFIPLYLHMTMGYDQTPRQQAPRRPPRESSEWKTSEVHNPTPRVLRDFDGPDLLWDFGVGSFKRSYTFFLRSTLYLELQIECHASLVIDGYDLLRASTFGGSEHSNSFSSKYFVPTVPDQAPHVHLNQWLGSTLGLRRSGVPDAHTTFSPKSDFTRIRRSVDACLFQIDGHDVLREFSTLVTPLSSEVAIFRNGRSVDTCPQLMDDSDGLWLSGLREFLVQHIPFSPGVTFLRSAGSDDTCPFGLDDSDLLWLFGLRECQPLHTLFLLECLHLKSTIHRCVSPTDR